MTRLFAIIAGGSLALAVPVVGCVIHHSGWNPFMGDASDEARAASPSDLSRFASSQSGITIAEAR